MSDSLNTEDQMERGAKRFSLAYSAENWKVDIQGLKLIVSGDRLTGPVEVHINRVFDMADSVFTALEQLREKLWNSTTMKRLLLVLLVSFLAACESEPKGKASLSNPQSQGIGRFVLIPEASTGEPILPRGSFALDTITGNLCRTWDFSWQNASAVQKNIQDLPLCRQFYINSVQ